MNHAGTTCQCELKTTQIQNEDKGNGEENLL